MMSDDFTAHALRALHMSLTVEAAAGNDLETELQLLDALMTTHDVDRKAVTRSLIELAQEAATITAGRGGEFFAFHEGRV